MYLLCYKLQRAATHDRLKTLLELRTANSRSGIDALVLAIHQERVGSGVVIATSACCAVLFELGSALGECLEIVVVDGSLCCRGWQLKGVIL